MSNFTDKQIAKFWSKTKRVKSGCLEWTAGTFQSGYGAFQHNNKTLKSHRVAYEIATGIYPGKMFVCHRCDNKKCVEIQHLFLGTALDNNADMISKGRYKQGHRRNQPKGMAHHKAILTENSVNRIRIIGKLVPQEEMAKWFKCSKQTISAVLRREVWKFVH